MFQIVDELRTFREENFRCPVCKGYLQSRWIRSLCNCGHLFCTPCINSLFRDDSSVVCSVCEKLHSEEETVAGDSVFSVTKRCFGELVQAVYGQFDFEGNEEAINALISNILTTDEQDNKKDPPSVIRKEKVKSMGRKRKGKLVQEEQRGISSDNESFEKAISTEVPISDDCSATEKDKESPVDHDPPAVNTNSDSTVCTEAVTTDISVNTVAMQRDCNIIMADDKNKNHKQYNICMNVNGVQNTISGDKNVKENNEEMEIVQDSNVCSESVLQTSTATDRVLVDGGSSNGPHRLLETNTFVENRRDEQSSEIDSDDFSSDRAKNSFGTHVRRTLKSSSAKVNNTKKKLPAFNVSKNPVLNDISNTLCMTSEHQVSPYKRELNRLYEKKRMDHVNNVNCSKSYEKADDDDERENCTPSKEHKQMTRRVCSQMDDETDNLEEEMPNHMHMGNSSYSKHELKKKKKLSLSRRQKSMKTSELTNDCKEDTTTSSSRTNDEMVTFKNLLSNACRDSGANETEGWLIQKENLSEVPSVNNSLSRALEETDGCVQDRIMGCNENSEGNESRVEIPDLERRDVRCDRTLDSPTECKQGAVSSSTPKFNGSLKRKHDIESDYIQDSITGTQSFQINRNNSYIRRTQEDSAEKRMEVADEDDDVVAATPTDITGSSVRVLVSDSVPTSKTCFERQNLKDFNLGTSLIEKAEDLVSICEFADRYNGIFSRRKSSVTKDTTHLIMKPNENNRVHQTFKYLQAIVLHKPVVSFEWIQKSLKCGLPLPEEEFLILGENGENAVELSLMNAEESLFQNFSILVLGPVLSGLRSCSIEDLLITGGAYVVKKDVFSKVPRSLFKVVLTDEEITENLCREHCMKYSAITLPVLWVFDSIAEYKLAPWQKYVPRAVRKIILYEFHVIRGPLYISSDEEND